MIKKIGLVDVNKGWNWLKSLENKLKRESWNSKVNTSGRMSVWFGIEVELGLNNKIKKGLQISEGLRKRGNKLWGGEDWNSTLSVNSQQSTVNSQQ